MSALLPRKIVVIAVLSLCVIAIVYAFWHQEIKYSLPTPVPVAYRPITTGERVLLPVSIGNGTAYFFHFYNSDCPCSRFNAKHIRSLIGNYGEQIRFVILVDDESSLRQARREFGDFPEYMIDQGNAIAKACGVYSTPQAAIVTKDHQLFYRGNYNRSRYCTTRATNFAELSLVALINQQPSPQLGIEATQAYGCQLDQGDNLIF